MFFATDSYLAFCDKVPPVTLFHDSGSYSISSFNLKRA